MILNDIADLFEDLAQREKHSEIARHFGGRERKWIAYISNGTSFRLDPEFIAGLRHYGYCLKLERIDLHE